MNFNPSLIKPLSKQILARSAALAAWIARFLARMFNDVGGCTKKYFLYIFLYTEYKHLITKAITAWLFVIRFALRRLYLWIRFEYTQIHQRT